MSNPNGPSVAFLLFPDVTQLDLTGPAQVLSRVPGASVHFVAKTSMPVPTDCGFSLLPTGTFADVGRADIVCVPGGVGDQDAMEDGATMDWLRRVAGDASWVTSVCTGALILGAAGLLRGYRATTHWSAFQDLALFGAIPTKGRVVFDRNRVTGGGVTAGIDFALKLADTLSGRDVAELIQLALEYDPAPPFDCGSPEKAGEAAVPAFQALAEKRAPDRVARRRALARKLGYGSRGG
jgi:cyclohexyl-isocyanide hydratase